MKEANWSDIPEEINYEIAVRIQGFDDLVRFGAVSKSWQSSASDVRKRHPHRYGPWLMLPENEDEENSSDNNKLRKFYCLCSKSVFKISFPEASEKRCLGSGFGWLLTTGLDGHIDLLDPLTHSQIPLPSPRTLGHQGEIQDYEPEQWRYVFVTTFAMSTQPSFATCTVMIVYGLRFLAFARPGAQAWTDLQAPKEAYDDVIFFHDKFYAVSGNKMLRVCDDIDALHPKMIDFVPIPDEIPVIERQFYLVEMFGDLHLVVRYFDRDEDAPEDVLRFVVNYFDVYKLDFGSNEWTELASLGEYAIFIGTHSTFSISTLDHPQLKANSIYFTDDYVESYTNGDGGGRDMGIYDYEEDTIEPFYPGDDILSTFCTPMLFMPNFI